MNDLKLENRVTHADEEQENSTLYLVEQTESSPDLLLMMDIESLALGPRPVITQIALLAYDLENDEYLDNWYAQYLPIEPQQQIIPPRRIQASTLAWWMKQSDEARDKFDLNAGDDFEDLVASIRGLLMAFDRMTNNGAANYELCAKGPQFDVVAVETLILELGLEVPWKYDRVTDLRTDLRRARINPKNVPQPKGCVPHTAYWDARWQIEQYLACRRIRNRA